MKENTDGFASSHDECEFAEPVSAFEDSEDWSRTKGVGHPSDEIEKAARMDGTVGELSYTHRETHATLYLLFPDYGEPAGTLKALLYQPLDPCLPSEPAAESFTGWLYRAQKSIAAEHGTEYVTAVANPDVILHVNIPLSYDQERFKGTVTALNTITRAVNRLHEAVWTPLREHL